MTPLRILMICPQFRPLLGGYERAAERLSLALAAAGHRVVVVTERRDPAWSSQEWMGDVLIRRLRSVPQRGWHVPSALFSLVVFLLLNARRFDVIHAHQYGWTAAAAIGLGHLFQRPVVLKLTATGPSGILEAVAQSRLSILSAALHRRVDACIATSERGEREAGSLGIPEDRIHLIPNGLDTDRFRPASLTEKVALRARLGLGEGVVALYVGRLSSEKNPLLLLQAWAECFARHANCELVVLGDGPQLTLVREVARGARNVHVRGRVDDPLPWYQAADIYVLPSDFEGLSNSLVEALSCGLPVVSTCVSGSEDVFREADVGELVPVGDSKELSRALERMLADPGRRAACSKRAREVALRRFSIVSVRAGIESIYGMVLRSRRATTTVTGSRR